MQLGSCQCFTSRVSHAQASHRTAGVQLFLHGPKVNLAAIEIEYSNCARGSFHSVYVRPARSVEMT